MKLPLCDFRVIYAHSNLTVTEPCIKDIRTGYFSAPLVTENRYNETMRSRTENLSQTANIRKILHGISNIQHTLANFEIRLDTQGNYKEDLTK